MEYRILGPLEVLGDDGAVVTLAGVRERTLLATLLVSANHVVSTDRLIDVLWGEGPPPSASNALQVYVSKLRKKLEVASGTSPISTEHSGYVLNVLPGEIDAARFEELVRSSEATGPEEEMTRLSDALSLWRGEVLSGLDLYIALHERSRLDELRLVAIERRADAELSLGHHQELVGELESIASTHPLRERLQGQLMVALYRCGRQGDALAVYRRTRTKLAEELGIDPSKSLQDLELAVLNQAPEIAPPSQSAPSVAVVVASTPVSETLTFLFTDLEGSTEKLARLRDIYSELLAVHHQIIRASLASHQGREINNAGDGFFAVFTSPSACVSAAIEMQRALASYEWPGGEKVRVRMGVHTGEASETGSAGLVGLEVNRAARIGAVGHGGQVLLSAATAALLRDSLPDGAHLRDLGAHRLKDLGLPEQIFQLEADGLEVEFPPLRSLENPELRNNLPVQLTSFIGREWELGQIRALVKESRLVTLTGSGGVGKTRLALQAAAELVDGSGSGVWLVDLAPLSDPDLVAASVAQVVGVTEEKGRPRAETLIDSLSDRNLLIVLDNCEHVIDACANLADAILRGCPDVKLLATSREPIGIAGERVYRVPSLTLPTEGTNFDITEAADSDALRLFADRAVQHRPDFVLNGANLATVLSVCRRLDGIPLAIELAAARLRSMAVADVEARLDQRFRLLTGGGRMALARQQTLRALVDWSYELLSNRERALLRRVSVFAGGWTLDAAEAVCTSGDIESWLVVDLLGSLVDKSLAQADSTGETLRYRLLETIRQYAAEQLNICDDAEITSVREKHAEVFLAMAETAVPHIRGVSPQEWLRRLEQEQDNLRTAFMYFIETPAEIEKALRLGVALEDFWLIRGLQEDGVDLLVEALGMPEAAHPTALRASALKTAGRLLMYRDGPRAASVRYDEGLAIAQRLGDSGRMSDHLMGLASVRSHQGDRTAAIELADEALCMSRDSADGHRIAMRLYSRGEIVSESNPDQARADFREALHRSGQNKILMTWILGDLGCLELGCGNFDAARVSLEEGRGHLLALHDDEGVVNVLQSLCLAALGQEDLVAAVSFSTEALTRCRLRGKSRNLAYCILDAALCASALGEQDHAAKLHGAADVLIEQRSEVFQHIESGLRERDHISLRQSMGEAVFVAAYETGRSLSPTDATSLGLEITMPR